MQGTSMNTLLNILVRFHALKESLPDNDRDFLRDLERLFNKLEKEKGYDEKKGTDCDSYNGDSMRLAASRLQ